MTNVEPRSREEIVACLRDARARSLALLEDLDASQWLGPELAIVNPPGWEIGVDALFDSAAVAHDLRWRLALPDRRATLAYAARVLDAVCERLSGSNDVDADERSFHLLALFHEDMHGEAFVYTRQTLGYRPPPGVGRAAERGGPCPGDAEVPGGTRRIGTETSKSAGFAFDNERDAHDVRIAPFRIARAAVTQGEFRRFVEDDGYARRELWSDAGWEWRAREDARHPVCWRRDGRLGWSRRRYDAWVPLEEHVPVHFVNAHEADAYCRWAGRRLPSEAEWECAAGSARFPWGDDPPTPERALLDLRADEPCEVGSHPAGDSPFGLRQMIGNVWEWTASTFGPYPGFRAGPYREYSEPWFGTHRVLRGGAFATRARLLRNSWRNFYTPDRRDVLAGFRTCAR